MTNRSLIVTLDTEVDKSRDWRISRPASFISVHQGIPERLSPLFDEFGVTPTYLLSPEVIEDEGCVEVLRGLGTRAELGTHLHGDFVEPRRRLDHSNMAGARADTAQCEYPPDVEREKLSNLTLLFKERFGYSPTAFRAGRFALSPYTHSFLAELGYRVDSSITPGLKWIYNGVQLDYRDRTTDPTWIGTDAGPILELPIGIQAGSRLAPTVERAPRAIGRVGRALLGDRGRMLWLRPSWLDAGSLIRYVQRSRERLLVAMFHSVEVVPGASPYADSQKDVDRILDALRALFSYCAERQITFSTLSDGARFA